MMVLEQKMILARGGLETPCILREPDFGTPRRVVLGVHGIGGSMQDFILESIADEMELFGSAVVRFDLPAHGENEMDIMSLSDCLHTLDHVAEFSLERWPDVKELCIFATGFGAYLTLIALQELRELPCKLKLVIQTPTLRMDRTLLSMAQVSQVTLEAMEWAVLKAPRPIGITYSFYEELRDNNAFSTYPIPLLILHGQYDDYIPMSDIQQLQNLNDRAKLVIIPGASHRFEEPGAWDMVLDLTRDWFDFEQVLLTETS